MFVTVIIPTYHDWSRLALCLASLRDQSYAQDDFEVLVVNNAPEDPCPETINFEPNVALLEEAKPGSYAARNKALQLAKGELLAFTDSDCIADKDWIMNAVAHFKKEPSLKRIAGHIELFYTSERRNWAEVYESVYAFRQDIAATLGASVTGNMFAYSYLFQEDKVGTFNDTLFSGGDHEWSIRAKSMNLPIEYKEDVIINHPARDTMRVLVNKSKRITGNVKSVKGSEFIQVFRFLVPPIRTWSWSRNKPFDIRIKAFTVKYYLNLIRFIEGLKIVYLKKGAQRV
ncbi:glycosyltransferase [Leeuwenhoekiella blandensis]|uniref:RfbQ n=1 Tax=Leeuwenhoekiella blandensis (strain CECT 7118 / CCUG 51940 / KCTC 22103 / MED217) TaxID=398720 RepID=A3XR78_LEEBM|nr:glycosyltransferase family 2 protein [Leeuwenhoekiella blandensis]EAQ47943.1 RfbQ [Leeuwenhoekiella blandensis MED217]